MSRTVTTHLTTFNLPHPSQATLNFSSDLTKIVISIPQGSQWHIPLHWHIDRALSCISVQCLSGHLRVYKADKHGSEDRLGGPGTKEIMFEPEEMVSWSSARKLRDRRTCTEEWSVAFVVHDQNLYRNTSSAILDRDIYPQLSSTPFWLKLLFNILRLVPQARAALLSFLLWVQLRAILYAHGFHEYHGRVNLTWPWMAKPAGGRRPPQWVLELQLRIQYLISRVVMASCYWLGRLMLGMRGQYPEYTAMPDSPGDRQMADTMKNGDNQ